mmetsp:Transcript_2099/g.3341  ORF Transcript_2099/g.3341 Transcript_2099/m.3341 type:complete len:107 (-) Transcript_2099:2-322(-)
MRSLTSRHSLEFSISNSFFIEGKNFEAGPFEAIPEFTVTPCLILAMDASPDVSVSSEFGSECSAVCGVFILILPIGEGANPNESGAAAAASSSRYFIFILIMLKLA